MRILITGANGMLGKRLMDAILKDTEYTIVAAVRNKRQSLDEFLSTHKEESARITILSNDKLVAGVGLAGVDVAIHTAFSRRNRASSEIAESVYFCEKVFRAFRKANVKRVINLSSQAVYGLTEEIRCETMMPSPETPYAMAKFASEALMDATFKDSGICYTNLRLDLIAQSQPIVEALCRQGVEGTIHLRGGMQEYSFLDAEDVPRAILAFIRTEGTWECVYNVGWNRKRYNLVQIAEIIKDLTGARIELSKEERPLWYGMDTTRFRQFTGWSPVITLGETIKRYVEEIGANNA